MYKTRIVHARRLMIDDRFKVAGSLYRVKDVSPTPFTTTTIWAYDVETDAEILLTVSSLSHFKIYNLV